MGKRIVIKGANFATNGMKEQYIERTTSTEQGFVNLSLSADSSNSGKLGLKNNAWAYNRTVHSNSEITLHPNDTLVIMELPGAAPATTIAAISLNSTGLNYYPSLICLSTSSSALKIGTIRATTKATSVRPNKLTNTSSEDWTIIIGAGWFSTDAPSSSEKLSALYKDGVEQSGANVPYITYRIYTEHPENYPEPEEP
jgi:hypothetical protein